MRIQFGLETIPRFANIVYAPATSIGVASAAPSAIAGVAPTFMLMPGALREIEHAPIARSFRPSFIVGMFSDFASACRTVTVP